MKHCSKCKKDFPDDDNFCDECGSELTTNVIGVVKDNVQISKNKWKEFFVSLSLILSIISVAGLYHSLYYIF
jgi:predicted amidophosphoribosyltransferase